MKKTVLLSSLIAAAMLFSNCGDKKKSNNNPTGPGGVTSGSFKATLSGDVNLSFNAITAYGHTSNTETTKEMTVVGEMTAGTVKYSLTLSIDKAPATGNYTLGDAIHAEDADGFGIFTVVRSESDFDTYFSATGTAQFTTVGTTLKGTFSFTAEFTDPETFETKQITVASGTFEVPVYN
jgi:hypothetical protein